MIATQAPETEMAVKYAIDELSSAPFQTLSEFWVLHVYAPDGHPVGIFWHPRELVMTEKRDEVSKINPSWKFTTVKYSAVQWETEPTPLTQSELNEVSG